MSPQLPNRMVFFDMFPDHKPPRGEVALDTHSHSTHHVPCLQRNNLGNMSDTESSLAFSKIYHNNSGHFAVDTRFMSEIWDHVAI